ncbi:hypothetical protein AOLI_G00047900 [Acnodon oligacanthus]
MTERFVVVPVGQGNGNAAEGLSQEPSTLPAAAGGGGGEGDLGLDEREAVPILEYSREPNKYGVLDCPVLFGVAPGRSIINGVQSTAVWSFA